MVSNPEKMFVKGRYYIGDLSHMTTWERYQALEEKNGEYEMGGMVKCYIHQSDTDGYFCDNIQNEYTLDSGILALIHENDIDKTNISIQCCAVIDFDEDFEVKYENDTLHFGDKIFIKGITLKR